MASPKQMADLNTNVPVPDVSPGSGSITNTPCLGNDPGNALATEASHQYDSGEASPTKACLQSESEKAPTTEEPEPTSQQMPDQNDGSDLKSSDSDSSSSSDSSSESESGSDSGYESSSNSSTVESDIDSAAEDDHEGDKGVKEKNKGARDEISGGDEYDASETRTRNEVNEDNMHIERPDVPEVDADTELIRVGQITSVMDNKVVVMSDESLKVMKGESKSKHMDEDDMVAWDEGSLLVVNGRKVLGKIHETFGPVWGPMYLVRFNQIEEINGIGVLKEGTTVWGVKGKMKKVRVGDIRTPGCDGSNIYDEEGGDEAFSDDEKERQAMKRSKGGGGGGKRSKLTRGGKWGSLEGRNNSEGVSNRGGRSTPGEANNCEQRYNHQGANGANGEITDVRSGGWTPRHVESDARMRVGASQGFLEGSGSNGERCVFHGSVRDSEQRSIAVVSPELSGRNEMATIGVNEHSGRRLPPELNRSMAAIGSEGTGDTTTNETGTVVQVARVAGGHETGTLQIHPYQGCAMPSRSHGLAQPGIQFPGFSQPLQGDPTERQAYAQMLRSTNVSRGQWPARPEHNGIGGAGIYQEQFRQQWYPVGGNATSNQPQYVPHGHPTADRVDMQRSQYIRQRYAPSGSMNHGMPTEGQRFAAPGHGPMYPMQYTRQTHTAPDVGLMNQRPDIGQGYIMSRTSALTEARYARQDDDRLRSVALNQAQYRPQGNVMLGSTYAGQPQHSLQGYVERQGGVVDPAQYPQAGYSGAGRLSMNQFANSEQEYMMSGDNGHQRLNMQQGYPVAGLRCEGRMEDEGLGMQRFPEGNDSGPSGAYMGHDGYDQG